MIVELRTPFKTQRLGRVEQQFGIYCCCATQGSFQVFNAEEKLVSQIKASWTGINVCDHSSGIRVDLTLLDATGSTIIDPLLLNDSADPEASPFGIQVPAGLDCAMKAILVGFLADIVSVFDCHIYWALGSHMFSSLIRFY